ncbi:MAG: PepSY domain-containing protein [Planctomycetota bacterium]
MPRIRYAVTLVFVIGLISVLHAADKRYPCIEKYAAQIEALKMPLKEAMNKVMEQYGGIPIGGNLDFGDEGEGFIYRIQTVRPEQDGKSAGVWEIALDAETGEMIHMENATRHREKDLRRREEERRRERERDGKKQKKEKKDEDPAAEGKYPYVEAYIARIQKGGVPIQEAMNSIVEEHGGFPVTANMDEEEEGFVVTVMTAIAAKDGKPARLWEIAVDAATGELMHISNAARWMERELVEREKDRERARKEREEEERKEGRKKDE